MNDSRADKSRLTMSQFATEMDYWKAMYEAEQKRADDEYERGYEVAACLRTAEARIEQLERESSARSSDAPSNRQTLDMIYAALRGIPEAMESVIAPPMDGGRMAYWTFSVREALRLATPPSASAPVIPQTAESQGMRDKTERSNTAPRKSVYDLKPGDAVDTDSYGRVTFEGWDHYMGQTTAKVKLWGYDRGTRYPLPEVLQQAMDRAAVSATTPACEPGCPHNGGCRPASTRAD